MDLIRAPLLIPIHLEYLLQAWINEEYAMVILSMLHNKHTISEHHEHPLPLLLLLLGATQQIK